MLAAPSLETFRTGCVLEQPALVEGAHAECGGLEMTFEGPLQPDAICESVCRAVKQMQRKAASQTMWNLCADVFR